MSNSPTNEANRDWWERGAEWPLTVAALLFLAAYAYPILYPDLSDGALALCQWTERATWVLFAIDYVMRVALSDDRKGFIRGHITDLVVVVVPILRPLRLLRLITMLHTLNRYGAGNVRGRVGVYVVGGSALILFVGALSMLDHERGQPGANIETFGDALWWATATVTTVGYGDRYPVTTTGRFIAAAVMIAGIALIGTVTATIATWLIDRVRAEDKTSVSPERVET